MTNEVALPQATLSMRSSPCTTVAKVAGPTLLELQMRSSPSTKAARAAKPPTKSLIGGWSPMRSSPCTKAANPPIESPTTAKRLLMHYARSLVLPGVIRVSNLGDRRPRVLKPLKPSLIPTTRLQSPRRDKERHHKDDRRYSVRRQRLHPAKTTTKCEQELGFRLFMRTTRYRNMSIMRSTSKYRTRTR